MAEDQQPDPVETPELAAEFVNEDVYVVVSEKAILEMLRAAVKTGADPDLLYAEFWANAAVDQVIEMCDCDCVCCVCDEDDDNCECECSCDEELEAEAEDDEQAE